jgi:hypothetical protein
MACKCWPLKIRQFLGLKVELLGVTVATEPKLLSLLSTSDIKAVGPVVLLTWGGTELAGRRSTRFTNRICGQTNRIFANQLDL